MTKTVLSELELIGLIQDILSKGRSQNIREWMDRIPNRPQLDTSVRFSCFNNKSLGFLDFDLWIPIYVDDPETGTVMEAFVQMRKKSKWFSQKECRRVFRLLVNTVAPRYAKVLEKSPEYLVVQGGSYDFSKETKVTLEKNEEYDFIILQFARIHD